MKGFMDTNNGVWEFRGSAPIYSWSRRKTGDLEINCDMNKITGTEKEYLQIYRVGIFQDIPTALSLTPLHSSSPSFSFSSLLLLCEAKIERIRIHRSGDGSPGRSFTLPSPARLRCLRHRRRTWTSHISPSRISFGCFSRRTKPCLHLPNYSITADQRLADRRSWFCPSASSSVSPASSSALPPFSAPVGTNAPALSLDRSVWFGREKAVAVIEYLVALEVKVGRGIR